MILQDLIVCACLMGFINAQQLPLRLAPMNIKRDQITLSGFSSGGLMAQQVQISYSSLFSGIAVFSQTYYRCGPGDGILVNFDRLCTKLGNLTSSQLYDPQMALRDIENYSQNNLIDDPQNMKYSKLYLYAGLNNFLFTTDMMLSVIKIYEKFMDPQNIQTRIQDAELVLASDSFGGNCAENAKSNFYISNCGVSAPYEAMRFLLGEGIIKPSRINRPNLEPLLTFDQTEFFTDEINYMNDFGFIYIPRDCIDPLGPSCHLHFYFHGCFTGQDFVGDNHIINSGFLELAELNRIIMIFPQNRRSNETQLGDLGCWDTYGVTGGLFATKKGIQVQIVKRMLDRILSPTPNPYPYPNSNSFNRRYFFHPSPRFDFHPIGFQPPPPPGFHYRFHF